MSPSEIAFRDPKTRYPTIGRPKDYLHEAHTLRSWLFATDHKRIVLLYLASITGFLSSGQSRPG